MHKSVFMQKFSFVLCFLTLLLCSVDAQTFASASKGIFSDAEKVIVMSVDSAEATYTFNKAMADSINDSDFFYLIDENGNDVELDPDEILYLEISRGDESTWFDENNFEEEEEEEEEGEKVEYVDVYENSEPTPRLYYERVEVNHKEGEPFKGRNKRDSYLLQRVNDNPNDFIKVYVSPNFDEGGTEVAPLGELGEDLARNRIDYVEYEEFYIVKVGDEPAIRIGSWQYIDYAPMFYNKSREFRRTYSIPKEMSKERTKRRKKTSRKDVGKKKGKTSPLRYDEFPKHLQQFQKSYIVEEAARQKKIEERAAAREAARASRG